MSVIQIAKAICISIAVWIIPLQSALACSCVCITPTTARDKYDISQNRLAEVDFALIGIVIDISSMQKEDGYLFDNSYNATVYDVTVQPIEVAKGPLRQSYIFRYLVSDGMLCPTKSFYHRVGETLNILASYSPKDKSILTAHNGSCDCDSYFIFNEGGPLSDHPHKGSPS